MNDPNLNQLLKWSIQNSDATKDDPTTQPEPNSVQDPSRGLNQEALQQLLGAPSDADRMREALIVVQSPEIDLENKLVAFDNFEQLIETIDNANNMENLGLWSSLVEQLDNPEVELRRMAAWCIGTAVQNNPQAQQRALIIGVIPKLVKLALEDPNTAMRKKAVFALSSEVRNFQPGLDAALEKLPAQFTDNGEVDAKDMDQVDVVIGKLRDSIVQSG